MGTCAWIVGEAGSGKTRLARELASYARLRGVRVRWLGHSQVRAKRPTVAPLVAGAELLIADGFPNAGPTSVRAVEQLLASAGPRQLVLGTTRPPLDGLATLLDERRADVLILAGLETDALARLLGALSGETPGVDVTAAVARATSGNPSRVRAWLEAERAGMS
jgi:ABC-type glutathione transport system ATPase component